MARHSLRDRILDAGLTVMFRQGYVGAGVREIVAAAPAPQGSFTNHFRSKEEFARAVLDRYFDDLKPLVAETLADASRTPRQGRVQPRLPDRRLQSRGRAAERDAAHPACRDLRRMAHPFRRMHRRGPGRRRDREDIRPRGACRVSPLLVGGRDPAHEGRAQCRTARTLQAHHVCHRVQGAIDMTPDVSLPRLPVLDSEMAYREAARTDAPVALFLHGNPSSSYIWRNIIPRVAEVARCIAPDLIGFGQSGKPDIAYRFEDHVRYLDAFIANGEIDAAYLVAQDWGTALAFHLAARRPDFLRGLPFLA